MKVEFSPSQFLAPLASTKVKEVVASSAPNEAMPLQGMAGLQSKLSALVLTRSDKMDAARALVSSVGYPPEELFNGITHLLAFHLTM